jgi:hypothetical protein
VCQSHAATLPTGDQNKYAVWLIRLDPAAGPITWRTMDQVASEKTDREWGIARRIKKGRWAILKTLKPGDRLFTDGGFTCMPDGELKIVRRDENGLYVPCRRGKHYLDGQLDERGRLIGLYRSPGH